ncbi:hypothetical protein [Clostridium sp. 001]|uniref:ApeA N-terminal domain 1-containing protein n=1 Tax=Clostridium sp. 001 TaxID=1970093 RepID=UPI001C2C06B4|nr:hypothetical protein [Clostridium sp. 001]QXE18846.1 hypothetical protein B5S50_08390 [Clostridium sp. 001]
MSEKGRKIMGMWFLPKFPDEKLNGTLSIDDNGNCQLRVAYKFEGLQNIGYNKQLDVIHGFTANGKKITLLKCTVIEQQIGIPGFPVTTYTSQITIIGEWYSDDKKVLISEITASYDYLNYWIGNKPFFSKTNDEKNEITAI